MFLLKKVHESLSVAFRRFCTDFGQGLEAIREQSVSEARNKLNWEAFRWLFLEVVHLLYSFEDYKTWNGYRLLAVDGTKLSLPNYPQLREQFGTNGNSPMARASILYDVLNFIVCDAQIEPLSVDERTLAKRHIAEFGNRHDVVENIIIFDRGYPSTDLIDYCFENQVTFLMRVKRKGFKAVDEQTISYGYVKLGNRRVRVIKFRLDSGEQEVLLTNLADDVDFKSLYFQRWGVEQEFNVLKNTLEVENFSGRTETAIKQDFYINALMCNYLSTAYWDAQIDINATLNQPGSNKKYDYKVNVSQMSGVVRDYMVRIVMTDDPHRTSELVAEMQAYIAAAVVPVRPGRRVPRKLPRKAKFHHNRKPNL